MKCSNVVPWVAPTVLLVAACSREPPPTPPSTDLSHHKRIADAVRTTETLVLYEGLPHHHWEPDLLAAEVRSKNPCASTDSRSISRRLCRARTTLAD